MPLLPDCSLGSDAGISGLVLRLCQAFPGAFAVEVFLKLFRPKLVPLLSTGDINPPGGLQSRALSLLVEAAAGILYRCHAGQKKGTE